MYLSKAIGIDLKGEKLLGLVDGAQAIILTLLVIELPALIIEAIESAESTSTLAFTIAIDLIGYLTAALIVFDIWSLQKATIESTKPSRAQAITCIISIWLSSLVPVFFFLTEKFAADIFAESNAYEAESHFPILLLFRSILIAIIGSIYFINYIYVARFAEPVNRKESRYVRSLAKIRSLSLAIVLIGSIVLSSVFGVAYALLPLIAFIPILFIEPKMHLHNAEQ